VSCVVMRPGIQFRVQTGSRSRHSGGLFVSHNNRVFAWRDKDVVTGLAVIVKKIMGHLVHPSRFLLLSSDMLE